MPSLLDRLRARRAVAYTEDVVRDMVHEWSADRVNGLAAEVAFFTVLSIFPLLLSVAAALGSLEGLLGADVTERAQEFMVDMLSGVVGDTGSDLVDAVRSLFESDSTGVLTFSVAVAIVTASRGVAGVIRALDVVYDIDEHRSWLNVRLTALAIAAGSVVVGTVLLAMVVLGPLLGAGPDIAGTLGLGDLTAWFWDNARVPVAFLVVVGWATAILHFAPDRWGQWRWDLPGGVLAGVLWVVVSFGFRLYLDIAAAGNQILGLLGGGLVLLLWVYFLSMALLVGGELNAVLAQRRGVTHAGSPLPKHL